MIIDVYIYIVICLFSADELLLVTGGCIFTMVIVLNYG